MLFTLNEDSQSLTAIYSKIKNGEIKLLEGQRQVRGISCGAESTEPFQSVAPAAQHDHQARPSPGKGGAALLDMDFVISIYLEAAETARKEADDLVALGAGEAGKVRDVERERGPEADHGRQAGAKGQRAFANALW